MGDDMPFGRDDRGRSYSEEMRMMQAMSDRIMQAIAGIKTEFKSDLLDLKTEMRQSLSGMMPRTEYEARHKDLEKALENMGKDIENLQHRGDVQFSKIASVASLIFTFCMLIVVVLNDLLPHLH